MKTEKMMDVTIKKLPARRLAVMEHRGDPLKLGVTLDKLIVWAKAQPINLKPKAGDAFGFGYHDPRDTPPEAWRFDLVPQDFKLSGDVMERVLPAGRYAVTTHKGSHDNIGDTIHRLYRNWLPQAGRRGRN
ncbi:MAG: AraC family transcriptional regulator [Holosporaceae bacterium]